MLLLGEGEALLRPLLVVLLLLLRLLLLVLVMLLVRLCWPWRHQQALSPASKHETHVKKGQVGCHMGCIAALT
jgi:hypothetical protein